MSVESADFNAFVGAETGLLKGLALSAKASLAKNFHSLKKLDKQEEITCMAWGQSGEEVITGLRNGMVRVFDREEKRFVTGFDCSSPSKSDPLRGVARLEDDALVTAAESGAVRVWRYKEEDRVAFNTVDEEVKHMGKRKKGKRSDNEEEDDKVSVERLASLRADRRLCAMKQSRAELSVIATGGQENDLQIWDLNKPDLPVFRAKNVPPNHLQLRVPVWVSDLCFPDASTSRTVATVNRHGQVRLYDARTQQRRPVREADFQGETLTSVAATPNSNQVVVGTTTGQLGLFDIRGQGLFRKYKGSVGSIRSVSCATDTGYVAAVGLDRFFRVYHVDAKPCVSKLYLKSRLNCVLLADDFDPTKMRDEKAEEEERVDNVEEEEEVIEIKEEEDDETFWNSVGATVAKKQTDASHEIARKKRKTGK